MFLCVCVGGGGGGGVTLPQAPVAMPLVREAQGGPWVAGGLQETYSYTQTYPGLAAFLPQNMPKMTHFSEPPKNLEK